MRMIFVWLLILLLTGCQKTIWVPSRNYDEFKAMQGQENIIEPANFYVCGDGKYQCQVSIHRKMRIRKLASGKKKITTNKVSTLINKPKEIQNEKPQMVKSCKIHQ